MPCPGPLRSQEEQAAIPDRTPEEVKCSEELDAQRKQATAGLRDAFNLWGRRAAGLGPSPSYTGIPCRPYRQQKSRPGWRNRLNGLPRPENCKSIPFLPLAVEFPSIFHRDRPGFDVVVGNPPWNEITVEELAFYALRDPGLRGLPSLADRRKRIAELDHQNPTWHDEFQAEQHICPLCENFFSAAGGYQLQGVGDKDLYQLFCERYRNLVRPDGFVGVVLPRTAFLAEGAKGFRQWLLKHTKSRENRLFAEFWSLGLRYGTARYRCSIRMPTQDSAEESAFRVTGPSANLNEFAEAIRDEGVSIRLSSLGSAKVIPLLPRPGTRRRVGQVAAWCAVRCTSKPQRSKNFESARCCVSSSSLYGIARDAATRTFSLILRARAGFPYGRGRSFDQYDPHGNEPAGSCDWEEVLAFVHNKRNRSRIFKQFRFQDEFADPATHPINHCRVAFRDVTNRSNSRTVIACLIPPRTPLTNKAPYVIFAGWGALAQASVFGDNEQPVL